MQTWKDEMQYIYAGQATFPEDVDPWNMPNESHCSPFDIRCFRQCFGELSFDEQQFLQWQAIIRLNQVTRI